MNTKLLRDSQYMQKNFDIAGFQAAEEIDSLRKTFAHCHVNNAHNEDDSCKQCGLDLRNPIHLSGTINEGEK